MSVYIWHANYGEIFCDIFSGFSIAGFMWNFDVINWAWRVERRNFCFGVLLDKWVLLCTLDLDLNLYHFVRPGLRA
jgi:hypothetical protein